MMGVGIPLCQLCGWRSYMAIADRAGEPIWLCRAHHPLAVEVEKMLITCGKVGEIAAQEGFLLELAETFAQELSFSTVDPHRYPRLIVRRRNKLPSLSTSLHSLLLLIFRSKELFTAGHLSTSADEWRRTESPA